MTSPQQAARDALAQICADVASAQSNRDFVSILQYLTADEALPDEVAQRLLDICDGIPDVIETGNMLLKNCTLLITDAVMRAAIKIKEEQ